VTMAFTTVTVVPVKRRNRDTKQCGKLVIAEINQIEPAFFDGSGLIDPVGDGPPMRGDRSAVPVMGVSVGSDAALAMKPIRQAANLGSGRKSKPLPCSSTPRQGLRSGH